MGLNDVQDGNRCFGCGKENASGFQLEFELDAEGRLETRFRPRENHGGWEGIFHGGLMATLLDEVMLACLHLRGFTAATASLEVRFREPVRIGEELLVRAWETAQRGRFHQMEAEARRGDVVVARGSAKCLRVGATAPS